MVIARSKWELEMIEKRKQRLKDRKWKFGWSHPENVDDGKNKKLEEWMEDGS